MLITLFYADMNMIQYNSAQNRTIFSYTKLMSGINLLT